MNDLIHYDAAKEEENKLAVLNKMANVETEKVKYEGMVSQTKVFKKIKNPICKFHIFFNYLGISLKSEF